ncbi:hypothetical protein [Neisseria arctica]|uniref:hypothetical protein n=1 Tax=Neisseria arctica TaxID=1470200 RepID=UPI000AE19A65|nr:hypothetical protein [Neisseria arctica]UOO87459.1 hypothetical protein LVJ86_04240 [Neisseria arctica]
MKTTFMVKNKCLVIEQGRTQTTFSESATKQIVKLLIREIYGKDAALIHPTQAAD